MRLSMIHSESVVLLALSAVSAVAPFQRDAKSRASTSPKLSQRCMPAKEKLPSSSIQASAPIRMEVERCAMAFQGTWTM